VCAGDNVKYDDLPDELSDFLDEANVSLNDVTRVDFDQKVPKCWGLRTKDEYVHQSMPDDLKDAVLKGCSGSPVPYVGYNGAWLCTWEANGQSWLAGGLSRDVNRLVREEKNRIENAWISPYEKDYIYMVLDDGTTSFFLPENWHSTVISLDK